MTLGLFITFNGLAGWFWGYIVKSFPTPFPTTPIQIAGVDFSAQDVGVIVVSLITLGLITLFFQKTKLGLAMRAAALYPEQSRVLGIRVGWMLALGWGLAAVVGAVSGIMIAPVVVPRSEHDAERHRLRVRVGGAGRDRKPNRRGRRRAHPGRRPQSARHLR